MRKPRLGEAGFQANLKGELSSQMPRNYIVKLHRTVWKLGEKLGAAPGVQEGWDKSKRVHGQPERGQFRAEAWASQATARVPPEGRGPGFQEFRGRVGPGWAGPGGGGERLGGAVSSLRRSPLKAYWIPGTRPERTQDAVGGGASRPAGRRSGEAGLLHVPGCRRPWAWPLLPRPLTRPRAPLRPWTQLGALPPGCHGLAAPAPAATRPG